MISKSVEEMNKEETKMDMTPMIDVTFQLLIFFMSWRRTWSCRQCQYKVSWTCNRSGR